MESEGGLTLLFYDGSQSLLPVEFVMWKRFEIRTVGGILVTKRKDKGPSISSFFLVIQWHSHSIGGDR